MFFIFIHPSFIYFYLFFFADLNCGVFFFFKKKRLSSWQTTNLDRSRLAARNIKIARPSLLGYIETREEFNFYCNELFRLIGEEKFTVRIHEVYPLKEVARAHTVSSFTCGLAPCRVDMTDLYRILREERRWENC